MQLPEINKCKIAVIGLGYVGLPLAIEFAKKQRSCVSDFENIYKVIGFDIDERRIDNLKNGFDENNEINQHDLGCLNNIYLTSDEKKLLEVDVFIVTVPTPIYKTKTPNTYPLRKASQIVGSAMNKSNSVCNDKLPIIIYESTVYPGATEEICIPILEKESDLILNKHFLCGYSPERINPGDKKHGLKDLIKITSGSNQIAANWIDDLYSSIIQAGTFKVKSIKIAEAAKVIENTQRDLNIALINELAIICSFLHIDTLDVIQAASTKWNFLPFKPGLVGGHCIGVDPYYLTHKAEELGYHPEVVLAGRRINDSLPKWIAERIVLNMIKNQINVSKSKILILGYTFKENCSDFRNTKVHSLINELSKYDISIDVLDPLCDIKKVKFIGGIDIHRKITNQERFDCVILTVAHDEYKLYSKETWNSLLNNNGFIFDLKGIVPRELNPIRI